MLTNFNCLLFLFLCVLPATLQTKNKVSLYWEFATDAWIPTTPTLFIRNYSKLDRKRLKKAEFVMTSKHMISNMSKGIMI